MLCTQLKQTNLESWLHISTESSKESFDDTVFQHFVNELKHFNPEMWMDWQLVPVFCVYIQYFWCLCYLLYDDPFS